MTLKTGASIAVLAIRTRPHAGNRADQHGAEAERDDGSAQDARQRSDHEPGRNSLLAKDFIGLAVYSPDKLKIGTINDLILSKDGKTVEGFVIGVGGFLGIGEKNVALKMDRLQISNTRRGRRRS